MDAVCDTVIRQPLETLDTAGIIENLQAGDILFVDGSHRCFTNSDVTVVFLEILPRLQPGVLVHFHDILLPYDYPPAWSRRYYSEQYLLACWLLGSTILQWYNSHMLATLRRHSNPYSYWHAGTNYANPSVGLPS